MKGRWESSGSLIEDPLGRHLAPVDEWPKGLGDQRGQARDAAEDAAHPSSHRRPPLGAGQGAVGWERGRGSRILAQGRPWGRGLLGAALIAGLLLGVGAGTVVPGVPPAGLGHVWDKLEPMVARAVDSKQTELEARFGMEEITSGGFPSGVPEQFFREVCQKLEQSAAQGHLESLTAGWETSRDLHYTSKARITERQGQDEVLVHKVLLERIDMCGAAPTQPMDCKIRFSWKREREIEAPPNVGELGALEGVRQKKRKSFAYKMWRYDLSVVHGAPVSSPDQIPNAILSASPSYEIEMEFMPKKTHPSAPPAYLAHSMLLKAQDMCALLLKCQQARPMLQLLLPNQPPFGAGNVARHSVQSSTGQQGHKAAEGGDWE